MIVSQVWHRFGYVGCCNQRKLLKEYTLKNLSHLCSFFGFVKLFQKKTFILEMMALTYSHIAIKIQNTTCTRIQLTFLTLFYGRRFKQQMISSIQQMVCKLYANALPFYVKNSSVFRYQVAVSIASPHRVPEHRKSNPLSSSLIHAL